MVKKLFIKRQVCIKAFVLRVKMLLDVHIHSVAKIVICFIDKNKKNSAFFHPILVLVLSKLQISFKFEWVDDTSKLHSIKLNENDIEAYIFDKIIYLNEI